MPRIAVVGSVNLDLVASARRLPAPGETVTDATLARHPGGKGANQALAARRMGADVSLTARVGADAAADEALALLRSADVDLSRVAVDPDEPTGIALIVVAEDGENQIVVVPGANRRLRPADVAVEGFDAVVCQLEVPVEAVVAAADGCAGLFCLNAAPVRPIPSDLIERTDLVVVNEVERSQLGTRLDGAPGLVAVTLGERGALLLSQGAEIARATPPPIDVRDTVGAGDAFVAALVVGLAEGVGPERALEMAVTAGAIATTVPGAQPSLPTRRQVEELL